MAATSAWVFSIVFLIAPLLLLLIAAIAWDAPILLVVPLLTWIGIGLFLGAAAMGKPGES